MGGNLKMVNVYIKLDFQQKVISNVGNDIIILLMTDTDPYRSHCQQSVLTTRMILFIDYFIAFYCFLLIDLFLNCLEKFIFVHKNHPFSSYGKWSRGWGARYLRMSKAEFLPSNLAFITFPSPIIVLRWRSFQSTPSKRNLFSQSCL